MVVHKEFKIPLPLTTSEYFLAQLFMVAEESKNETGGGDGVEVLVNEPFEKETGEKGQYTHKRYSIQNKVPKFVRAFAPKGSLIFHEKAWNAFPNCITQYENEYFGEKFKMVITSRHTDDDGTSQADYGITDDIKKVLKSVVINVANNKEFDKNKYHETTDPNKYSSEKAGRGPFLIDFAKTCKPIMCCHKYYYIHCKIPLIGSTIENYMDGFAKTFLADFHRKLVCNMNGWYGLTIDDIRKIEDQTKAELDKQINEGPLRGTLEKDL